LAGSLIFGGVFMGKLHPLKLKRLERGLSQHALSFESGVPQVRICYAEKGYPALNEKQKSLLAKALGVPIEEIFPKEMGSRKDSNGKTAKS
jgi:transcriptional regulator with XRE-family HTH domain